MATTTPRETTPRETTPRETTPRETTPRETTLSEVALLRLVAQRLAGPKTATAVEVVGRLGAVQAQDLSGALTSVALRTGGGTRAEVEAELAAGTLVRSWPMRGTLHLVAAADLRWLLPLTAARAVVTAAHRRVELDLDDTTLERARQVAVAALAGGRQLRRAELLAAWEEQGVATAGQRGYHLIGHLAQTGTLCFGPLAGTEQLIVLLDEWVPRPRELSREEALGELALRYFRSHGPATRADFARWTGLLAPDVQAGMALARPQLAAFEIGGTEYLLDPETPELLDRHRRAARGVFLLPGFDEFMLGYGDRGAALPAEFAGRIIPGGNGVFQPTIVHAGQVVGTWKHTGRGGNRTLAAAPFAPLPERVNRAVTRAYAALP